MRTLRLMFLGMTVAMLLAAPCLPALAAPPGAIGNALPVIPLPSASHAAGRPEMHSYQPYSGLQFGFRPSPPVRRGVLSSQPRIIMPKRVAPLIEYGGSAPDAAQWYAYCADRPGTVDPPTGAYAPRRVPEGQCP